MIRTAHAVEGRDAVQRADWLNRRHGNERGDRGASPVSSPIPSRPLIGWFETVTLPLAPLQDRASFFRSGLLNGIEVDVVKIFLPYGCI